MLKQRVWTALVLILVFLISLFYLPAMAWSWLIAAIALGAAWEWSRLCGLSGQSRLVYVMFVAATIASLSLFLSAYSLVWLFVLAFWLVIAPIWMFQHWVAKRSVLLVVGLIVLVPTWLAFVHLRDISPVLLLFLMGLVWLADSAAYFSGRQWGKRKLAPRISPGKTWEGVAGALIIALVYVTLWQIFAPEALLRFSFVPDWGLGITAMLLVVISIVGDLFESHLKRLAGLKDSGNLIPGHGGILDRIDSLTAVLPVTMALIYFAGFTA